MITSTPIIGQKIKLFATPFNPEAIAIIQSIRGTGTLQAIEARILLGQLGPRIRIAHVGQWESNPESHGGEGNG